MSQEEECVTVWRIYAGRALRDPDCDPLELQIQQEVFDDLRCNDEVAWQAVLGFINKMIARPV